MPIGEQKSSRRLPTETSRQLFTQGNTRIREPSSMSPMCSKKRRDKLGTYYFNLINPIDRFAVQATESGTQALIFENLALTRGYAPAAEAKYRYTIRRHVPWGHDSLLLTDSYVQDPQIILDRGFLPVWMERTPTARMIESKPSIIYITIHTSYNQGENWSKGVDVYLRFNPEGLKFEIIGIQRET